MFSVLLLIFAILVYKILFNSYWKKKNVKEVWGSLNGFVFGKKSVPECYKDIYDKNDTAVGMYLGSKPFLLLKHLEDIHAVVTTDFQNFPGRGFVMSEEEMLSNNIILSNDLKKWKCLRYRLAPLFTNAKLKNMFYIIDKCAQNFVDLLEEREEIRNNMSFDAVCVYTTSTIGAAVFGINTVSKKPLENPFIKMVEKSIHPSFRFNSLFLIGNLFPTLFKKLNLKFFEEHEELILGFLKKALDIRRNDRTKRHDFIDLCIELQNQGLMKDVNTDFALEPTDELLAAQAFSLFVAGVETSSITLHFIMLELANHPTILAKVQREVDSVFENGKEELTVNDIGKLQFLDMVMSEAMRKYPPVGLIQRVCTKTTILPASQIKVEAAIGIVIPIYALHMDKQYFPNPEQFEPERFAPENLSKIQKGTYIPFGDGNRMCIGNRFALLQVKAAIAWMLHRFTLELQDYRPKHFDNSPFSIRDTTNTFKLIPRSMTKQQSI